MAGLVDRLGYNIAGVPNEGDIIPEVILPSQFEAMRERSIGSTGIEALCCAIMWQALKDLQERKEPHERLDAIRWFRQRSPHSSFGYVCQVLRLDASAVRLAIGKYIDQLAASRKLRSTRNGDTSSKRFTYRRPVACGPSVSRSKPAHRVAM